MTTKPPWMRYITHRPNRDGTVRSYWQRPGFPLRRLPADARQQAAEAERLNAQAEGRPAPKVVLDATWAAVILAYRESDRYRMLAPASRVSYDGFLRRMAEWHDYPATTVTGRVARTWLARIKTLPARRVARALLLNLYEQAIADGYLGTNPLKGLRLPTPPARDRYVLPAEYEAASKTPDMPNWFAPMLGLLLYTAQRPGDAVRLAWPKTGEIRVRQEKTRALCAIPVHTRLAAILEDVPRRGVTILTTDAGKPVSYQMAWRAWKKVAAGGLQLRDFRRTAVVMMADAGCTIPQIAAVTGHSIARTQRIIDVYWVATREQAQAGIARWERHKTGAESNAAAEKV